MGECIERAKLLKKLITCGAICEFGECLIKQFPTVDAVPVVRCKDCVYWDDDPDTYGADNGPKGKCMKLFETMCADDFCSYGKRKEDA